MYFLKILNVIGFYSYDHKINSKSEIPHFEFSENGSNDLIAIDSNYYPIQHK